MKGLPPLIGSRTSQSHKKLRPPLTGLVYIEDLGFSSHSFAAAPLPQNPPPPPSPPPSSSYQSRGASSAPSDSAAPERHADAQGRRPPLSVTRPPKAEVDLDVAPGGGVVHTRVQRQSPRQIHGRLLADAMAGSSMASPRAAHGWAGRGCADELAGASLPG